MNINVVHQKLADDEVLRRASAFSEVVGMALFEYTCTAESVEDCCNNLDEEGNEEAVALLREVYRKAARALDRIDDAHGDYCDAFRKLADFVNPAQPRDIFKMSIVDALYALNGRALRTDITYTAEEFLGDAKEDLWPATFERAIHDLQQGGFLTAWPPGMCRFTDKGWELAERRLQEPAERS